MFLIFFFNVFFFWIGFPLKKTFYFIFYINLLSAVFQIAT